MKYKWLYIGLIFSIMMALVPVSTLAYTNTPHNFRIPRPKNRNSTRCRKVIYGFTAKKWRVLFRRYEEKRYLFNI